MEIEDRNRMAEARQKINGLIEKRDKAITILEIKKLIQDMIPIGNYDEDEPVISKRDVKRLLFKIDQKEVK